MEVQPMFVVENDALFHNPAFAPGEKPPLPARTDFELPEGAKIIAGELLRMLARASDEIATTLMGEGLTEVQANMTLANIYIETAAAIACETARTLLGRDPDLAKWRAVTEETFLRVARVAVNPIKTEAAEVWENGTNIEDYAQ